MQTPFTPAYTLILNLKHKLEIFDEKNTAHRWSNVIAGRYAAGLLPAVDILTAEMHRSTVVFESGRPL